MFQLTDENHCEVVPDYLSIAHQRTIEILQDNSCELAQVMNSMQPPLQTVEELYDAVHWQYRQKQEQVTQLAEFLQRTSQALQSESSFKVKLLRKLEIEGDEHTRRVSKSQAHLQQFQEELEEANQHIMQGQQELRSTHQEATVIQEKYRLAMLQSDVYCIRRMEQPDERGSHQQQATPIDLWESKRAAMQIELQQLRRLVAAKDEIIGQHELGRISQLEDLREQQLRTDRIRHQSTTLEQNIKAILQDNRQLEGQVAAMATKLRMQPRRLSSMNQRPMQLLTVPLANKISMDEYSPTLKRCMSILSNRSRSQASQAPSITYMLPKRESLLLELPTFDTDGSFMLHTSVLNISQNQYQQPTSQSYMHQQPEPQLPQPIQPTYCSCQEPTLFSKFLEFISDAFHSLSQRLVRKRILHYCQVNSGCPL